MILQEMLRNEYAEGIILELLAEKGTCPTN